MVYLNIMLFVGVCYIYVGGMEFSNYTVIYIYLNDSKLQYSIGNTSIALHIAIVCQYSVRLTTPKVLPTFTHDATIRSGVSSDGGELSPRHNVMKMATS